MLCSRLILVSFTIAAFTGCASYQSRPLNVETGQAQIEGRRLDDPGLRTFLTKHGQPAEDEWNLSRLTLAGLYFSPELDVARARFLEAEAGIRTAEARPNPTFNFAPTYHRDTPARLTPWILGYALDVPVETAGKRGHRAAEARYRADAARLHVAGSAWEVRSAIRRALTDLHAAEAMAGLWRAQKPLLAEATRRSCDSCTKSFRVSVELLSLLLMDPTISSSSVLDSDAKTAISSVSSSSSSSSFSSSSPDC